MSYPVKIGNLTINVSSTYVEGTNPPIYRAYGAAMVSGSSYEAERESKSRLKAEDDVIFAIREAVQGLVDLGSADTVPAPEPDYCI